MEMQKKKPAAGDYEQVLLFMKWRRLKVIAILGYASHSFWLCKDEGSAAYEVGHSEIAD
jgi:hypothetical protein